MGSQNDAQRLSAQIEQDFTRIIEQGREFPVPTLGTICNLFDRLQRVVADIETDVKAEKRAIAAIKRDIDELHDRLAGLEGDGGL